MTDEAEVRRKAVATILTGVAKKTALVVSLGAAAALVLALVRGSGSWWLLPASVVFGGVLGLLNFRWLATAVQRVYLRQGATSGTSNLAAAFISILKLSIIFVILFIVIKWQLLHIFGVVAGLSLSFLAIIWEGATAVTDTLREKQ